MADAGLGWFNRLPVVDAARELRACLDAPRWAAAVVAQRPYPQRDVLAASADAAAQRLTWPEILEAVAAHPRIGERVKGWSAGEQAGVADADRSALVAGNEAYEERFGHVFLICATGRTGAEMSAELHRRLRNEPAAEQREVRRELAAIARLRLGKLLDSASGASGAGGAG